MSKLTTQYTYKTKDHIEEYTAGWCSYDCLNGYRLRNGEKLEIKWEDGATSVETIVVVEVSYQISDHGHPCTIPTSKEGVIILVDLAIGVGGFVLVMCILYLFGYYAAPKMFGLDSSFEFSLVERILAGVLVALTILGLCLCLFALSFLGGLIKGQIIGG